ncbi:MAG TPA: hypothetical protein VNN07_13815 [Candidatus Tectomicrobia bacterium]|nr:hypothetical protein [Candidatus Tectomicrobia bacterium]
MEHWSLVGNERGTALPLAMITLVLLATLLLAFTVLAHTEPQIASNHLRVTQARALAESGFERAVWALSQGVITPGCADCLAHPLPAPVPKPYDGSEFVAVANTGGFVVTVSPGTGPNAANERNIRSEGWTPTNDPADTRTKAHRVIQATVERFPDMAVEAPCALCVKGALDVGGNATIDGASDTSCGNKKGSYTADQTNRSGSAQIKGADGNANANDPTDYVQYADPNSFNDFTLTPSALDKLRELAKRNGTYFGPGYPNGTPSGGTWNGSVTFNSGNQLKNGVVFIDSTSGEDITASTPSGQMANVTIHGNPFVSGTFTGWLIVNGSLSISGSMEINGMVYAMNDLTYNGTGTGRISGLAISQNIKDTSATTIDSTTGGNSKVIFNCEHAKGGGFVPMGFVLKAGTYREISD